jgi:hypothetical protein
MGEAMYLTQDTSAATLRQLARLAAGSTFVMSFVLPLDLLEPAERTRWSSPSAASRARRAAATPLTSPFFCPARAGRAGPAGGLPRGTDVSASELAARYFAGRADGIRPSAATGDDVARRNEIGAKPSRFGSSWVPARVRHRFPLSEQASLRAPARNEKLVRDTKAAVPISAALASQVALLGPSVSTVWISLAAPR